jgi:hypothetical protein
MSEDPIGAIVPVTLDEAAAVEGAVDIDAATLASPEVDAAVDACPARAGAAQVSVAGNTKEVARCGRAAAVLGASHGVDRDCCRACCAAGTQDETTNPFLKSLIAKLSYVILVPETPMETADVEAQPLQAAAGRASMASVEAASIANDLAVEPDDAITSDTRAAAVRYLATVHGRDLAERVAMTSALAGRISEEDAVSLIDQAFPEGV